MSIHTGLAGIFDFSGSVAAPAPEPERPVETARGAPNVFEAPLFGAAAAIRDLFQVAPPPEKPEERRPPRPRRGRLIPLLDAARSLAPAPSWAEG